MINENIKLLRKEFLAMMHDYIDSYCDRDTLTNWNDWLVSCCTDEILDNIADDKKNWEDTCRIFHKLVEEEE